MTKDSTPPKKRGFAALSPEKHREISSKGGKAVPPEKRSFSINPDLASSAGKKGGHSGGFGSKRRKEGNNG